MCSNEGDSSEERTTDAFQILNGPKEEELVLSKKKSKVVYFTLSGPLPVGAVESADNEPFHLFVRISDIVPGDSKPPRCEIIGEVMKIPSHPKFTATYFLGPNEGGVLRLPIGALSEL